MKILMKQAWFSTQELLSVVGLPGIPIRGCVIFPGVKNVTGGAEKGRRGRGWSMRPAVVKKALMRREMRDGDDVEWALEAPAEGGSIT